MEWKHSSLRASADREEYLGNFLSGMETSFRSEILHGTAVPLETSLVEWKHPLHLLLPIALSALETSLVEWKLNNYSVFELGKEPWKLP